MSVPEWPGIHIIQVEHAPDGSQIESVLTSPVCDFCGDQNPCWDYDCERFELPEQDFGSLEGWASCRVCSDFIEADDYDGLLQRALFLPGMMGEVSKWETRIRAIHQGFRQHRIGERKAWG